MTSTTPTPLSVIADAMQYDASPHDVLAALRDAGIHLLTTPQVEQDVPQEAVDASLESPRFGTNPDRVRYRMHSVVDNETLEVRWEESLHALAVYRDNEGMKDAMRRKVGHEFVYALWQRLDPEGAPT